MNTLAGAWTLLLILAAMAAPVAAQDAPGAQADRYTLRSAPLTLAPQPEPAKTPDELLAPAATPAPAPTPFGEKGSEWIVAGLGIAHDFSEATDYNLRAGYSQFLVKNLEFALELNAWYFDQEGEDAVGLNPSMVLRWHFVNEDPWTVFADLGIGVLLATDNVPDGGTSLDFTPGAGIGFTRRIGDSGARLQAALRWHHISNGRINGDGRNPSRDAPAVHVGVQWPF